MANNSNPNIFDPAYLGTLSDEEFNSLISKAVSGGSKPKPLAPRIDPKMFETAPEVEQGSRALDVPLGLLKGAIGVPEAAVGLADLVTKGYAGKGAEKLGFKPKEAKRIITSWQSPQLQKALQEVEETKGFVPTIGAMVKNPSTIVEGVAESAPSMVGAGGIARGILKKVLPKIGGAIAGGIGEGVFTAGSSAEQIRQELPEGVYDSVRQPLAALASGALTGGIGAAGGKIAKKLGIADVDTMLAEGVTNTQKKGLFRSLGEGALSEGVLEEMPQSMQEQGFQNLALGKPFGEGVAKAGASGLLVGGLMGGGGNLLSSASGRIVDDKKETTLKSDAPTQEAVAFDPSASFNPNFKYTAENIMQMTSPEDQELAQQAFEQRQAEEEFANSPEGRKQAWEEEIISSPKPSKAADQAYDKVNNLLNKPYELQKALRDGTISQQEINELESKKQWMETNPAFIASSSKVQAALKKRQAELDAQIKKEEQAKKVKEVTTPKSKKEAVPEAPSQDVVVEEVETAPYVAKEAPPVDITEVQDSIVKFHDWTGATRGKDTNVLDKNVNIKRAYEDYLLANDLTEADVKPADVMVGKAEGGKLVVVPREQGVTHNIQREEATLAAGEVVEPTVMEEVIEPAVTGEVVEAPKKKAKKNKAITLEGDKKPLFKKEEKEQVTSKPTFSKEDAHAFVKKVLGDSAKIETVDEDFVHIVHEKKLKKVPSSFVEGVIYAATGHSTLYENVKHESIHAARALDAFTPQEWNILKRKANKWIKQYNIREKYTNLDEDTIIEEAVARAFEDNPSENSIFGKIREFFDKMVNLFMGEGFTSAESILREFEAGKLANRVISSAMDYSKTMASIKNVSETFIREERFGGKEFEKIKKAVMEFYRSMDYTPSKEEQTEEHILKLYYSLRESSKKPTILTFMNFMKNAVAPSSVNDIDSKRQFFTPGLTNLSFADLMKVPVEKRVDLFFAKTGHVLTSSRLYKMYQEMGQYKSIDDLKNQVTKEVTEQNKKTHHKKLDEQELQAKIKETFQKKVIPYRLWTELKSFIEDGIYLDPDGGADSFHGKLNNLYLTADIAREGAKKKRKRDWAGWDEDCAIFAFINTGFSNPVAVPELFLNGEFELNDEEEVKFRKSLINGYRYKLGLDQNARGISAIPIENLVKESKLIKDIASLVKEGNGILKLGDYKEASDRNFASMHIVNYLQRISAIEMFDFGARTDSKLVFKRNQSIAPELTGHIEVRKAIDHLKSERTELMKYMAGYREMTLGEAVETKEEVKTDMSIDTSLGDIYIQLNPNFVSGYLDLSALENSDQMLISYYDKGVKKTKQTEFNRQISRAVDAETRRKIYDVLAHETPEGVYTRLTEMGLKDFTDMYSFDKSKPIDEAAIRNLDKFATEGNAKQARKLANLMRKERKVSNKQLTAVMGEVREINGYEMPLPYSLALAKMAASAYKDFKHGERTTVDSEKARKTLTKHGEEKLHKVLTAVLLHQQYFGIPLSGKFGSMFNASLAYFNNNAGVIDAVSRASIFKEKTTELNADGITTSLDYLQNFLVANIERELNLIDDNGLVQFSVDKPNKIAALEANLTRTEKKSSIGVLSDLIDRVRIEERTETVDDYSDLAGITDKGLRKQAKMERKRELEKEKKIEFEEEVKRGVLTMLLSQDEDDVVKTNKLLDSFLTKLKKRNEDSARFANRVEIREEAGKRAKASTTKEETKGMTATEVMDYIRKKGLDEIPNVVNDYYNLLIADITKLRKERDDLDDSEIEDIYTSIDKSAEILGETFESKDVAYEKGVTIKLGKIFKEFGGKDWTYSQRVVMVKYIKDLIASVIVKRSPKIASIMSDPKNNIGLVIVENDTLSSLSIFVAEDAKTFTKKEREEYGTRADKYRANKSYEPIPFDESLYDTSGMLLSKVSTAEETIKAKKIPPKEKMAEYTPWSYPKWTYFEQLLHGVHKTFDALIKHEKAEEVKTYILRKKETLAASASKTGNVNELSKVVNTIRKTIEVAAEPEQAAEKKINIDYASAVVYEMLDNIAHSVAEERVLNGEVKLRTEEDWINALSDITARVKRKLLVSEGIVTEATDLADKSTVRPVYNLTEDTRIKNKEQLDELLANAVSNFMTVMRNNNAFVKEAISEYANAVETPSTITSNEIPHGTIYKPTDGSRYSIKVLSGTNTKTFVRYEVLDRDNRGIRTITISRKNFDNKFVIDTDESARIAHKTGVFDTQVFTEINKLERQYGPKLSPIINEMLTAMTFKAPNSAFTVEDYVNQLVSPISIFTQENFLNSGFTDVKEFKKEIADILDRMIRMNLMAGNNRVGYRPTKRVVDYLTKLELSGKTRAKMDVMQKFDNLGSKIDKTAALREMKKVFPQTAMTKLWAFIKNLVAPPWLKAKQFPVFAKMLINSGAKSGKREAWNISLTTPVAHVLEEMKELKATNKVQHEALHTLIVQGDRLQREFKTLKEAQGVSVNISQESFDKYLTFQKQLKELRKAIYSAGAHMYAEWANTRFDNEHEFTDILVRELVEQGKDYKDKDVVEGIVDKLLMQVPASKRVESKREMINTVKGFGSWLEDKRTLIAKTPGWMPRIRFAKDYLGSVKKDGKYVAFKYFDSIKEAEEYTKQFEGDRQFGPTGADMKNLFTTMDQIREMDDIEDFLSKGMTNDQGQPHFGISILDGGESGGVHLDKRSANIVEGYEHEDYIFNYTTAINRMANSFAHLQYGLSQRELLKQAREEAETNQALKNLLPEIVEHLKIELDRGNTPWDFAGSQIRDVTILTFMGFRLLPALINSTQPFTVGIPMLAKELAAINKESYSSNLANAAGIMTKSMGGAFADFKLNVLSKEKTYVGRAIEKMFVKSLEASAIDVENKLTSADKEALAIFHKYNIAMQSVQASASIIDDYKEEMIAKRMGLLHQKFHGVVNESMTFMRLTEQLNRAGSFLAAYRAFSKNSPEFSQDAVDKAVHFVYNSQFMNNSMNMPLSIKQMGPIGRTLMTLSMYPIHLLSQLYSIRGDKNGVATILMIVGMAMILGGTGAIPFSDVIEALYNKFTGSNATLDMRNFMKRVGTPDGLNNAIMRGFPTLVGVDVANNLTMQTPYIGIGKTPIEGLTGASGAIVTRYYRGFRDIYVEPSKAGKTKAFLSTLPEFIAAPSRAIYNYNEGMKTQSGSPQMYQGKQLKIDLLDLVLSANPIFSLKTSKMGGIQEKRQAIRELEKRYKTLGERAVKYARETGDMSLIQEHNKSIIKNKVGGLIKPIKLSKPKRESSGKVSFESRL